jgi:hypothetical protein
LALDSGANLYLTDIQNAPHIKRVPIAAPALQPIYTRPLGGSGGVGDVEVDLANGKLYWIEREPDDQPVAIRFSNLDGSMSDTIRSAGGSEPSTPRGLAVDSAGGKLYWTESGFCDDLASGRILSANLDGTNLQVVKDGLGLLIAIEVVR